MPKQLETIFALEQFAVTDYRISVNIKT